MATDNTESTSILDKDVGRISRNVWNKSRDYIGGFLATTTLVGAVYFGTTLISDYTNNQTIDPSKIKSTTLEEEVRDEDGKIVKDKDGNPVTETFSYRSIPHKSAETGYVDFRMDKDGNGFGISVEYLQNQRELKLQKESDEKENATNTNYDNSSTNMNGGSDVADENWKWKTKKKQSSTDTKVEAEKTKHNDHQQLSTIDDRLSKYNAGETK